MENKEQERGKELHGFLKSQPPDDVLVRGKDDRRVSSWIETKVSSAFPGGGGRRHSPLELREV